MILEGHAKVDMKWSINIGDYKEKDTHDAEIEKIMTEVLEKVAKENEGITFKITKIKNKLKKETDK